MLCKLAKDTWAMVGGTTPLGSMHVMHMRSHVAITHVTLAHAASSQVYAALDIPLSQEALGAMRAEHDRAAGGQHTAHRRQIEEFAAG